MSAVVGLPFTIARNGCAAAQRLVPKLALCNKFYRLRRQFLAARWRAPSPHYLVAPRRAGHHLNITLDVVIDDVVHVWSPKQRHLARPETDLVLEVLCGP
jgi:hypothetical protein